MRTTNLVSAATDPRPVRLLRWIASIAISLVVACAAHAQNIVRQYSQPYQVPQTVPWPQRFSFVAGDGSGNLFLLDPASAVLHRYDSTGVETWKVPVSVGSVSAMAVAVDGVYLGGQAATQMFLAKYGLDGTPLWTKQFGSSALDRVLALAVQATGVYVVGSIADNPPGPIGTGTQFIFLFDPAGNQAWERDFAAGSPPEIQNATADSSGLYIYGYDFVRRFDALGNDRWTAQVNYQYGYPADQILGVAADGDGGVYVMYFFYVPQYNVRHFDSAGNILWTKTLGSFPINYGVIAADSTGFYVASNVNSALPGQCYAGNTDAVVIRFDAQGNQFWTREFGSAAPEDPVGIAIGADGVDVTGYGFPGTGSAFLTTIAKSSPPISSTQPSIHNECVINSANFLGGGVAPGEIVTILGSAMGPAQTAMFQPAADGTIATTLAGARVLFDGEAAPLISVSAGQNSAIVPYDVAGKSNVNVQVEYNGVPSAALNVPVFASRLGVFSSGPNGTGKGAIVNQDGTVNSPTNPAARGSTVSIFGTGGGLPQPSGSDNAITGGAAGTFASQLSVLLWSDGDDPLEVPYFPAIVTYFGAAPFSVPGLVQINFQLPLNMPTGGAVPLYFGGVEQAVTIAIR